MLIISGHVVIDPSDLQPFMADIRLLAQTVRKREGNLAYDMAVEDPLVARVLVSERWQDQEALTAHLAATNTQAFLTRWEGRIKGDVLKYDAFNERGLLDVP
ncbi:putative quinol monooxygenase [Dickeya zeae]|uniref:putative quinol monooxygenase n=1 Tax=Dickeya zeae TaxID=204042 RepID=UPI0003611744|nr:antibiotic biosynthesis monooxygenase [Dickeya zeae]AUQ24899.1 antibiotic biosynthesis monooxygenase [Dickeya zeae]UJR53867.1 antibiotic biosynthesis monooxygenase [Dickeya zeae MS1]UJR57990.1 antibiotic biosynthesis monooxygenase [Dickeya zeae]UJR62432.1 antibiotic biosynthesis monooxygenase [Dickeya zeae]